MKWLTHVMASLLFLKAFGMLFNVPALVFCVLGALAPDIDEKSSKLGRVFHIPFSRHRGIIHSAWPWLFIGVAVSLFSRPAGYGFLIGSLSHLFLDTLTPQGARLFYPAKLRLKGPIRTGSFSEMLLLAGIIGLFLLA
jgi:membrane-bound metal-dependent hydrolase YbcI (DUF457 family)